MAKHFGIRLAVVSMVAIGFLPIATINPAGSQVTDNTAESLSQISEKLSNLKLKPGATLDIATVTKLRSLATVLPRPENADQLQGQARSLVEKLQSTEDPAVASQINDQLTAISKQLTVPEPSGVQKNLLLLIQPTGFGSSSPVSTPAGPHPDYSKLQRGDILFIHHLDGSVGNYLWAQWYSHVGIYEGGPSRLVYESNSGEGVRLRSLDMYWKKPATYVALARGVGGLQRKMPSALDWAESKYRSDGRTGYNYVFWNKWSDNRLYCSQLIYKLFDHLGVNVDSNDPRYIAWFTAKWNGWLADHVAMPAVAPDEVAFSPLVTVYSEGWN